MLHAAEYEDDAHAKSYTVNVTVHLSHSHATQRSLQGRTCKACEQTVSQGLSQHSVRSKSSVVKVKLKSVQRYVQSASCSGRATA